MSLAVERATCELLAESYHRRPILSVLKPFPSKVVAITGRPIPPLFEVKCDLCLHALKMDIAEPGWARGPRPRPALAASDYPLETRQVVFQVEIAQERFRRNEAHNGRRVYEMRKVLVGARLKLDGSAKPHVRPAKAPVIREET